MFRWFRTVGAIFGWASSLAAQGFVIFTLAGGAPPSTPAAALQMAIAPQGMAADTSSNLYFISSNCVFKRDPSGAVTRVAGNSRQGYAGDGGPALTAEFNSAGGLAIDAAGNLYVADSGNARVREITPNGLIQTVAGNGSSGNSGDGGPATNAQISIFNVSVDRQGNLYLVSETTIRKVSTNGVITTVAGTGVAGFSGDGGPATSAQIANPYAVAADNAGNLYIADDGNLRIRRVSPAGVITTVAGTGTWGMSGDGGPATSAQLTGASGIVLDPAGNLYFADSSRFSDDYDCYCVRKIDPSGVISTIAGSYPDLFKPRALALGTAGTLFVANTGFNQIAGISSSGALSVTAGNGASPGFSGDGLPAASTQLFWPMGVGVDGSGTRYIADTYNNRVRAISSTGIVTTVAGTGAQGFSGDGGQSINASVYFPTAVAADSSGNLYIADHGNSRIRKISANGIISTIAGDGTSISAGEVWGLAVDGADNLYFADSNNHVIRKISPDGSTSVVAGNGTFGYSGDGGPATSAQLLVSLKTNLATDLQGNVYFVDYNVQPPAPGVVPSPSPPSYVRKISTSGIITTVVEIDSSSAGGAIVYDSFLGGPMGIAVDSTGNVYVSTPSGAQVGVVSNGVPIPVAGNGLNGYDGDGGAAVSAKLSFPSGLATDGAGNVYVADVYNNAIRLLQPISSSLSISAVVSSASGAAGNVAPGEIVTLYGSAMGPAQLVSSGFDSTGVYPTQLAGTTVEFNGTPAPLLYTAATQVAAIVPYAVTGGTAWATVSYGGQTSAALAIAVARSAPGIFTLDSSGAGQAAALNQDSSVNSASNPARVGDIVALFATGIGEMSPAGADGTRLLSPSQPVLPVCVTIGGTIAVVSFAGGAPGEVNGMVQINAQIPSGIATGPSVSVAIQVAGTSSQPGVTIAVQ